MMLFAAAALLVAITSSRQGQAERLPDICWNSTNPWFWSRNKEIPLKAHVMDSVEIRCPLYNDTVTQDQAEYSIIYMVSEYGYKHCVLDGERPVGQCFSPYSDTAIRIVFREFTPLPNGLEFQPGQTYYFITTSDGTVEGVHNRRGGLCNERNMRLSVEMLPEFDEVTNQLERRPISPKFRHDSSQEANSKAATDEVAVKDFIHRLAKDHLPGGGGGADNKQETGDVLEPVLLKTPNDHKARNPVNRLSQLTVYEYSNSLAQGAVSRESEPAATGIDFQLAAQEPVVLYEIHETPYVDLSLFRSAAVIQKVSTCLLAATVFLVLAVMRTLC